MAKRGRERGSYSTYRPSRIFFGPKYINTARLRGVADVLYAVLDNCEMAIGGMPATAEEANRKYLGAVVYLGAPEQLDFWRDFNGPVVVVNNLLPEVPLPQVLSDDLAMGRLAAKYFLRRGFKRFIYVGDRSGFGILRGRGFVAALTEAGIEDVRCTTQRGNGVVTEARALDRDYPGEPVAVFACNDWTAHSAIHHAYADGLLCPDALAILGADNDPLPTSCCFLSISTVEPADYEIGRRAAQLLVRLLAGESPPAEPILVPPVGIISRESTDRYATDDPVLKQAVTFIQDNLQRGISVRDIARAAGNGTALRTLQRRFKQTFGVTLVEALLRARIDRAKALITSGALSIKEIAYITGFANPPHLSSTFLKLEGMTPSEFRDRIKSSPR